MSYYLLKETIQPCTRADTLDSKTAQYVAVLTTAEWERERESFDMGIDLDLDTREIHSTKAEVNVDSLTGTFQIPDREALRETNSASPSPWMKRASSLLTTAARRRR